jgi:RNase P subunit RPR2
VTKCPNCDSMLNWHSINLSLRLASDASFVDSEFTCDVCGAELTLTFDLAEVLVGGEEVAK